MIAEPKKIDGDAWVRSITIFWVACVVLVGVMDFFFYHLELLPGEILRRSFNIATEESLGTWISTSQSLLVGVIAAAVFARSYRRFSLKSSLGWAVIAMFFIYISADDAAKLHERLGTQFRVKYEYLAQTELETWFPSWSWQLFIAPFFIAIGAYIYYFLWSALAARLRIWVTFGFTLLAVAVAMDFVEGMPNQNSDSVAHLLRLTEELLEMFGTTVFLSVFLSTLNDHITIYVADKLTK